MRKAEKLSYGIGLGVLCIALVVERSATSYQVRLIGLSGGAILFCWLAIEKAVSLLSARRRRLLQMLQASERRNIETLELLHTALAGIGDAVIATDSTGTVTFMNPAAQQLTGWRAEVALGQPVGDVLGAVAGSQSFDNLDGVEEVQETTLVSRNGMRTPIDGCAAPLRGMDGETVGTVLALHDLTAWNEAKEAHIHLASIVESSEEGIVGKGLDGIVTSWNGAAAGIFGYTASEMIGGTAARLLPKGHPDDDAGILERILRGERIRRHETRRLRKDGREIDVELTASPILDARGRIVGVSEITRDITDRKQMGEQMLRSQKMESLSVLAGGIAHDFNNLLMGIIANVCLMIDEAPAGSAVEELGSNVLKATEQAAHLTRQMLAYSGRGRFVLQPLNISAQVEGIGSLVKATIPKGIRLEQKLDPDLPRIEGDPGQIEHVVMNLLLNATEATGAQGSVSIASSVRTIPHGQYQTNLAGAPLGPGVYVVLEVRDTGKGMDEQTQAKMFDPFFTTKFTGRGLGLAAVLGIVRGHNGGIAVSSELGKGTAFQVFFPVLPQSAGAVSG